MSAQTICVVICHCAAFQLMSEKMKEKNKLVLLTVYSERQKGFFSVLICLIFFFRESGATETTEYLVLLLVADSIWQI